MQCSPGGCFRASVLLCLVKARGLSAEAALAAVHPRRPDWPASLASRSLESNLAIWDARSRLYVGQSFT